MPVMEKVAHHGGVDPYLGFDYTSYPSDNLMSEWWIHSPFWFTGFYLGPTPYRSDSSWMTHRSYLKKLGWGFLIIYWGLQSGGSSSQGSSDADDAVRLAAQAGFPELATIFLDVESADLTQDQLNYISAWIYEMYHHTSYYPGVYCHSETAPTIKEAANGTPVVFWCINVECPNSPVPGSSPGCATPSRLQAPPIAGIPRHRLGSTPSHLSQRGCPGVADT